METNLKIIFILAVLIILMNNASPKMEDLVCENQPDCGEDFTCPSGQQPAVRCPYDTSDPTDIKPICDKCKIECARECGRLISSCTGDCDTCCASSSNCGGYRVGSEERKVCEDTCKAVCESAQELCRIILLLQFLSMGVGIIIFSINGLKWILSDSEGGRGEAKKGVVYTLFGLSVIMAASALVEYFYIGSISCSAMWGV